MAKKWFLKSRTFWGILVMLLTTVLGDNGVLNVPLVTEFLSGIAQDGAFTVGGLLALVGMGLRSTSVTLWKSEDTTG